MTDESPTISTHLSEDTTTRTDENREDIGLMSSPSSRDSSSNFYFYFSCAVVALGVVGTAANALILYALVASKQHKKHLLIFNQNALDLFSSVFTVITYSLKLSNVYLTGFFGYLLCTLLLSDNLIWWGIGGSMISLAVISAERYVKIVHPQWSKKKLFKRLKYSAAAFTWISSIIYISALVFPTTIVVDGACYPFQLFVDDVAQMAQLLFDFFFFYAFVLLTCIFGYWRILTVIRRQARVMAAHGTAGSSTGQAQSNQIQTNVIKTMILVSAFYAISFLPSYIFALLANLSPTFVPTYSGQGVSVFATFLYTCTNPFIYATNFNPVKKVLLDKLSCKKISAQASENVANRQT